MFFIVKWLPKQRITIKRMGIRVTEPTAEILARSEERLLGAGISVPRTLDEWTTEQFELDAAKKTEGTYSFLVSAGKIDDALLPHVFVVKHTGERGGKWAPSPIL